MSLSPTALKLLQVLAGKIKEGRFDLSQPSKFLGYGETLDLLELPATAPRADTDGRTLQINGLNELARWVRDHPKRVPKLTGLIVSKTPHDETDGTYRMPNVPGKGYFKEYGKKFDDWPWWLEECQKSIDFDWTPYTGAASPHLNSFARALIEKAGYEHGWENVQESIPQRVVLSSSRHKAEAQISPTSASGVWQASFPKGPPSSELVHTLPELKKAGDGFEVTDEAALGRLLRRAAELAMALPNQAADTFVAEIAKIEANPPSTTEVMALVKQRRGQELFRKALLEYWDGACAVTGITLPELLRASHAKPWADCTNDQERLNVFNGFLLCAHLDALFDRGLMTFDDSGLCRLSPQLDNETCQKLALGKSLKLRWLTSQHLPFLTWHRANIFRAEAN